MKLPGYTLVEELHSGTHARVHRARDERDGRSVIVKIAQPSPSAVGKLLHEFDVAGQLRSPSVATIHALERHGEIAALILEDFGARSLRDLLNDRRLDIDEVLRIAIQLAHGIGELHRENIIHMDINPSNGLMNLDSGEVKICDFGIASKLSRENGRPGASDTFQGTLAYISPEQTGRMNRTIDYRTDFYSLGISIYEMLIGWLPFQSDDPMELVHCHIAKRATPPHELNRDIPEPVSAIVMKLLAKTAEERYQSAFGLAADLERCLRSYEATRTVEPFTLATLDVSSKFHIPEKLYGRELPLKQLNDTFEDVCQASRAMVLVVGESGIGKSSLINEIHRPVVRQKGYFVSGKCDQFKRNIPYASLIQAFQELLRQILSESDDRVAVWRDRIRKALGSNGQLLAEVLPEIEMFIGPQTAPEEMVGDESRNRWSLMFRNFVGIFMRVDHPLVLFIDDLQWADMASIGFLESVLRDDRTRYFMFIGAFRDNEVVPGHPLLSTIAAVEKSNVPVHRIQVQHLKVEHINHLLSDTLRSGTERTAPLAELILRKTGGNPSFVIEFLKSLHHENALVFDMDRREWSWNLDAIFKMNITNNVVDLMRQKMQRLSPRTQSALQLAACIGNTFDLNTLAIVSDTTRMRTAQDLWDALNEGLILPIGDAYKFIYDLDHSDASGLLQAPTTFGNIHYKFSHDQVQRAAYQLISPDATADIHLRIGRLLLEKTPPQEKEEALFQIVNQINAGIERVQNRDERASFASLNLHAARRAKSSGAYDPALRYLVAGIQFLPDHAWSELTALATDLHYEQADCEYLIGHFERAEALYDGVLAQAKDALSKGNVYRAKVILYTHLGQWNNALEAGTRGLKLLGVDLPLKPSKLTVLGGFIRARVLRGRRSIADLANAPEMTDERAKMAMYILSNLMTAAYYASEELAGLNILQMNVLTLKYGNSENSPNAISLFGLLIAAGFNRFEAAYQYGVAAQEISEKFNNLSQRSRTQFNFAITINVWQRHLRTSMEILQKGIINGREGGDFLYMMYEYGFSVLLENALGVKLQQIQERIDASLRINHAMYEQAGLKLVVISYYYVSTQQFIRSLTGQTDRLGNVNSPTFDADEYRKELVAANHSVAVLQLLIAQMSAACFAGRFDEAAQFATESETYAHAAFGTFVITELRFFTSLSWLGHYEAADTAHRKLFLKLAARNQRQMKHWAAGCPDNYKHKFDFINAELGRIKGNDNDAMKLFSSAIASASEQGFIHIAALGNERAALFYRGKDLTEIAKDHIHRAHSGYRDWGATGIVARLEDEYPELIPSTAAPVEPRSVLRTHTSTQTAVYALDYESVMKAAHALTGEIVLEKLLVRLVRIIVENAGAQKGVLVLERDGKLSIEAIGNADDEHVEVMQHIPLEETRHSDAAPLVPAAIVAYVARTQEHVSLNDATKGGRFMNDPYIVDVKPVSVLCLPLVNQGRLTGVLYLENNLTEGAFTTDRLEVLSVLCTQAAVSLANAGLYQQLEEYSKTLEIKVEERTHDLQRKTIELAANNEALEQEKLRSDKLLHNILPAAVARELMDHGTTSPMRFDDVTVVMTDFKDFTEIAATMSPRELVDELNELFGAFDDIVAHHGLEKVKTIGDAYMIAGGLPLPLPDHAVHCVLAVGEMLQYLNYRNATSKQRWEMRVGVHTGPVVAGVVGKRKFTYDVWGDTVNIASRLESLGETGRINLSSTTYAAIKNQIPCVHRGKIEAKGKGEIDMYFVAPEELAAIV